VLAAAQFLEGVSVTEVMVNGGADTTNPGVTCIRFSIQGLGNCSSSWVGIPNNNRSLLSAALLAKSTNAAVNVYYTYDVTPALHCPGQVNTPCSLNSITLR